MADFLHRHKDFADLIRTVAEEMGIAPDLVEKDYWIMHCLYGLTQQGYSFELKGGTSLSKGFGIIHRFSEDIDIRIEPAPDAQVFIGKNQNKAHHCESRKAFYDLEDDTVKSFIGTEAYHQHKRDRFPATDYQIPIVEHEAFILSDKETRALYQENYLATSALYYQEQPSFDVILERIQSVIKIL